MTTVYLNALSTYGSVRKACAALGVPRSTFFDNLKKERAALDSIAHAEEPLVDSVKGNTPRYYIFTCAVRGAKVHKDFLDNLRAYSKHLGAEFVIGPLTSLGRQRYAEYDSTEFDPEVVMHVSQEPIIIGDRIRFCPEVNLSPTMVRPLQGLQTYTKRMWGIFPHTKISLETVATHKDRPTKFIATTGAVTHPFYTPTKAGYRAHFDHVHGAIIVEVTKRGVWFRHLTPANALDGTFYDLGYKVQGGRVKTNEEGAKAIIYGDIHVERLDLDVARATWGYALSDKQRESFTPLAEHCPPQTQVFHDLMDMSAANYHELDNLFKRFSLTRLEPHRASLSEGFTSVAAFLSHVTALSKDNVVVDSNHEYFIDKWLQKLNPGLREDFENITAYYRLKLAYLEWIEEGRPGSFLEMVTEAMLGKDYLDSLGNIRFLLPDESFEVDNIECGWHGHRGPNGRRGSKTSFKFVTEKSTIGHMHSPSIESGCHVVGTSSEMDLGYNQGPSSWAHTHGIIYPHGGRTLITMSDGKFWATQGNV